MYGVTLIMMMMSTSLQSGYVITLAAVCLACCLLIVIPVGLEGKLLCYFILHNSGMVLFHFTK